MGGKGGGSASPAKTPAETMAYNSAQPYLAEYNSGTLDPANQAVVNLADTNKTAVALQDLASSGMGSSSALGQLVGTVTPGTSTHGMQAGAGSAIDLSKLSLTQQILQSDLQTGMAYLQISSGQAADLAGIQQEQQQLLANAIGSASGSFANILGTYGGTDIGINSAPIETNPGSPSASLVVNDIPYSGYAPNPFG